ncbi:MAG: flagellar basal body P-ring formation chaperone FlgA [Nitrospirota bacterium]|nr:flagellar basal body P-ring formation chaperone FlgA [Nitrospirota bacterium]
MAQKNGPENVIKDVNEAISIYVARQLSVDVSEVVVESLTAMNGQKDLPEGKILKVRAVNRNGNLGRAVFVLHVQGLGGGSFNQWVSADVSQIVEVVVAARKLNRLDVLEAEDIHLQSIQIRRVRRPYLSDLKGVLGKRLTRSLRKGMPIREDQLEIAPLVQRGDRVTITVRSQGLQIVTSGKAKQDGQLGEMIRVMNLDSKKTVFAEVVKAGDVQIILSAKE